MNLNWWGARGKRRGNARGIKTRSGKLTCMKKILIADDDEATRKLVGIHLKQMLGEKGIEAEIHEAVSKKDLLQKFLEHKPDLAIIDNDMEDRNDGVNAIKELRAMGHETPVYLHTSRDRDFIEKTGLKFDKNTGHLHKAKNMSESLHEIVERHLR